MFNLIITIIAIALVVVLTATSVYYGGSAFSEGTADAIAATYINQAQQVQAAAVLFNAQEGGVPVLISELSNHLSSVPLSPAGNSWDLDGRFAAVTATIAAKNDSAITTQVCAKINESGSNLVKCGVGTDALITFGADGSTALVAPTDVGDSVIIGMRF
jgi:hypothetical protein